MNLARTPLLIVAAVWLTLCAVTVWFDASFPGPDVFNFKAAGVYFAQHGVLGGINLPLTPTNVELVYSFYPPVYAFMFGVWCKIFGVSLGSSTAFSLAISTARAALILVAVTPLATRLDRRAWRFIAAAVLLISIGPNNHDRPDELGVVFGLMCWLILARGHSAIWAGVCLGLCGATSPAAGVFWTMSVLFIAPRRTAPWATVITVAVVSVVTAVAAIAPIVIADPNAISRFLRGIIYNAVPYAHYTEATLSWRLRFLQFINGHSGNLKGGAGIVLLLFTLAGLVVWSWRRVDADTRRAALPLIGAAVAFLPFTLIFFTMEPLYLWFPGVALLVVLIQMTLRHQQYRTVLVVLTCGLSLFALREAKTIFDAVSRPSSQTLTAIQARLMQQIEPSARVAVWPDALFTLVGARPVEGLRDSCPALESYDYVFYTPGMTFPTIRDLSGRPELRWMCAHPVVPCFTVQDDSRVAEPIHLFGRRTSLYRRDFGGVLFKRTGC